MAIQLDKILADIAKEKALHPNNGGATKQEQEEAWARIGRLNKLSVHETRSIFIVLQKKYEQEKLKGNSTWKLFALMHQIHQEPKAAIKEEEEQSPIDEVEEYEMLEVQEQEEEDEGGAHFGQPTNSTGSASSDGESPAKSHSTGSPDKEERVYSSKPIVDTPRPAFEEKKLLNTLANNSNTPRASGSNPLSVAAAAVLQKKGITVKKTPSSLAAQRSASSGQASASGHKPRTTIQLPDSLKRKLSEEYTAAPVTAKKVTKTNVPKTAVVAPPVPVSGGGPANVPEAVGNVVHTTTAQLMQVKKERDDNQSPPPGINIITVPPAQQMNGVSAAGGGGAGGGGPTSSTAATVASTSVASTNGFSPHIEELDFKNDIIFDAKLNAASSNAPEIINLGNFDSSLPPTFFKNLCNSSRHEALGLYVANVMNRLSSRAAAKLELGILRAIVDVQSDELEQ